MALLILFANAEYKKYSSYTRNHVNIAPNGKTVCILGAGLAGLQAACELSDRGFKVILIEKTANAGGKLKTWKDKNFAKNILEIKVTPASTDFMLSGDFIKI